MISIILNLEHTLVVRAPQIDQPAENYQTFKNQLLSNSKFLAVSMSICVPGLPSSQMECGQYNEYWKAIHMMPEETVQATIDLKSKLLVPIHWGAFTLAFHDWTDPAERVTKKASELNVPVSTPKIGEPVIVGSSDYPKERWWAIY